MSYWSYDHDYENLCMRVLTGDLTCKIIAGNVIDTNIRVIKHCDRDKRPTHRERAFLLQDETY